MMVFMKVKFVMGKNMERVNIFLKTETYTKDKCTKDKCKEKVNIAGQIKMSMKVLFYMIKCVVMASFILPMETSIKDNL